MGLIGFDGYTTAQHTQSLSLTFGLGELISFWLIFGPNLRLGESLSEMTNRKSKM